MPGVGPAWRLVVALHGTFSTLSPRRPSPRLQALLHIILYYVIHIQGTAADISGHNIMLYYDICEQETAAGVVELLEPHTVCREGQVTWPSNSTYPGWSWLRPDFYSTFTAC